VAIRLANYGSFEFKIPLELPSSSYYQASACLQPRHCTSQPRGGNAKLRPFTRDCFCLCCQLMIGVLKVEVRCSDDHTAVGMSPVFSVMQRDEVAERTSRIVQVSHVSGSWFPAGCQTASTPAAWSDAPYSLLESGDELFLLRGLCCRNGGPDK
jgi:hypothetical protein